MLPPPPVVKSEDASSENKKRAIKSEPGEKQDKKPRVCEPTHAILCIDKSKSMAERDVQPAVKGGAKKTRWEAVFECAVDFARDQERQAASDEVVFSLVLFDDSSKTVFERTPLKKAEALLDAAKRANTPGKGTGFAAALEAVDKVASSSTAGVLVLFLSDGKPGDLCWPPPPAGVPIQPTFKAYGQTHPSAAQHLTRLCAAHGARLSLHYVAIHADGHAWLKKLVDGHGGVFHDTRLSLDDDDDDVQIVDPPAAAPRAAASSSSAPGTSAAADDDHDVQIVAVRTAEQAQHARLAAAAAAGNVLTIGSTVANGGSSMRSTFRAISSSLTSMRSSVAGGVAPQRERQVTLESAGSGPSAQGEFAATRMVLEVDSMVFRPDERGEERSVLLSANPFAQGGLRNVYAMLETSDAPPGGLPKMLVAKESRHVVSYAQRLAFHKETSLCQARAAELAEGFNRAAAAAPGIGRPKIAFLRADVYRLRDAAVTGGYRYLAVEERLAGKYEKFNSNNGFVLPRATSGKYEPRVDVPQAFSHFTYAATGGAEMVVDIQGSGFKYTDPQLHSTDGKYGRADRGRSGFKDFFASHSCNACCRALGLSAVDASAL